MQSIFNTKNKVNLAHLLKNIESDYNKVKGQSWETIRNIIVSYSSPEDLRGI